MTSNVMKPILGYIKRVAGAQNDFPIGGFDETRILRQIDGIRLDRRYSRMNEKLVAVHKIVRRAIEQENRFRPGKHRNQILVAVVMKTRARIAAAHQKRRAREPVDEFAASKALGRDDVVEQTRAGARRVEIERLGLEALEKVVEEHDPDIIVNIYIYIYVCMYYVNI